MTVLLFVVVATAPIVCIADYWAAAGPSEIDAHSIEDMGLSPSEAQAIHTAYGATLKKLLAYIAAQNKSLPGGHPMAYGGDYMSGHSSTSCKSKLASMCGDTPRPGQWYAVPYLQIDPPKYGVKAVNSKLDVACGKMVFSPPLFIQSDCFNKTGSLSN